MGSLRYAHEHDCSPAGNLTALPKQPWPPSSPFQHNGWSWTARGRPTFASRNPSGADLRCRWPRAAARRRSSITHSIARASLSSNHRNSRSCRLYHAVAKISVLVQELQAGLLFDELPGGNHRRERAGATPGGGAFGAYRCATNGGGGWGPGQTGYVGATDTSRPFASEGFSPRSPSACRAAAARHSA